MTIFENTSLHPWENICAVFNFLYGDQWGKSINAIYMLKVIAKSTPG